MKEKKTLKNILKQKFSDQNIKIEEKLIPRAYERFGSVAIVDMSNFEHQKLLKQKNAKEIKKTIADALEETNRSIKTILIKKDKLEGEFRTGGYEVISGKDTVCTYRENNCAFDFDIAKTYFSTKLGNERRVLAESVQKGEKILCAFAGVCPFPIVIAKNKEVRITAVEKNPYCKKYSLANIKKNKQEDKINFHCDGIAEFLSKEKHKYNRILMPAPKINHKFIDLMFDYLDLDNKKKGLIDYYCFCKIDKDTDEVKETRKMLSEKIKDKNLNCSFKNIRKCGNAAPYQYRIHIEIVVKRKKE